jgi:hypothetical protein
MSFIPPILFMKDLSFYERFIFHAVICLTSLFARRQRLTCGVLPHLTIVAAVRPNFYQPGPLTLLPIARSPSRYPLPDTAGGLLPHRFTHHSKLRLVAKISH